MFLCVCVIQCDEFPVDLRVPTQTALGAALMVPRHTLFHTMRWSYGENVFLAHVSLYVWVDVSLCVCVADDVDSFAMGGRSGGGLEAAKGLVGHTHTHFHSTNARTHQDFRLGVGWRWW